MRRSRFVALLSALLVVSAVVPAAAKSDNAGGGGERAYIIVLHDDANPDHARKGRGKAKHVFRKALKGYAADLTADEVAALEADPDVALVEPDQPVEAFETQSPATWGLDRIDQRSLPLSGSYSYDPPAGAGVTAYVIDTGIRIDHVQLAGRAANRFDAFGGTGNDCNGHGTHVAGTIGGTTHGVAKAVSLIGVRVLDCRGSGTTSGVIAGIDWVTAHHTSGPAVANMSLGGGASSALDQAVANSVADGITYAVAAGNSAANACNYSPARAPSALTVGATTSSDSRASYSNYGSCLDLFAPGSSITSAWHSSTTATNTISGTSMASPHVAGVAALYVAANPSASPAAVTSAIKGAATSGTVGSAGSGSPNLLLFSETASADPPPPTGNTAPTASFTRSCTAGRTSAVCTFTSTSTDPEDQTLAHAWSGASPTTATTATQTYTANGSFGVSLTVTDTGGLSSTASRTIACSWSGKNNKRKLSCS